MLNQDKRIAKGGLEILKHYESFKSKKYKCPAGKPTIGYGHVILPSEPHLNTAVLTIAQAEELLAKDMVPREQVVKEYVKVELTQHQFDALVSIVYNIGNGNFASSTLLKKINAKDFSGAAEEFLKWNKSRVNGVLTELAGLTARRKSERLLFLTGKVEFFN